MYKFLILFKDSCNICNIYLHLKQNIIYSLHLLKLNNIDIVALVNNLY